VFEYDGLRIYRLVRSDLLLCYHTRRPGSIIRGKRDRYADYFQNSIIATDVHRRFLRGARP